MNEQWEELKETITELRDNDGMGTQQEVCKFLVNYMDILEKQMQEPVYFPPCVDCNTKMNEIREAYDKLKNQEPCEDAISRQWLMECVNEGWIKFETEKDENRFIHLVRDIAPPVNPQPKTGHWRKVDINEYACDHCDYCFSIVSEDNSIEEFKYYPNCGFRMIDPQESEVSNESSD